MFSQVCYRKKWISKEKRDISLKKKRGGNSHRNAHEPTIRGKRGRNIGGRRPARNTERKEKGVDRPMIQKLICRFKKRKISARKERCQQDMIGGEKGGCRAGTFKVE